MQGTDNLLLNAIKLLLDVSKVMIPVITGYIALLVGGVGSLWRQNLRKENIVIIPWRWINLAFLLAIVSLGVWSGTLSFCIRASLQTPEKLFLILGPYSPATNFYLGRLCSGVGHVLFFLSILSACIRFWRAIQKHSA
jgi:hypothetical protein